MRPTDTVLEEEIFFLNLFSGATVGHGFGRRNFFLRLFSGATFRWVRPTDRVLEEEVFFCIYLAVRPFDGCDQRTRFWKKKFFLNLFSGATDGQGFGRRIFFF